MGSNLLVVYLPVLHRGYLDLFARHRNFGVLCIVGQELLAEVGYREKEIRALPPETAAKLVRCLGRFEYVDVLTPKSVSQLLRHRERIVVASDEVTRKLAETYWSDLSLEWDTEFLRWDTTRVFSQNPVGVDSVTDLPLDQAMMLTAEQSSQFSSDWWRQVGAVAVREGKVVFTAYNRHDPSEHTPYAVGDPRDFVQAGQHSELCSASHSEGLVIAAAARKILNGASFYVTTFPCASCARLLAHTGITKLYFKTGHASLDGEKVLRSHGVTIIQVT